MHFQALILLVNYQQVQGKDPVDDGPGNNNDNKSTCILCAYNISCCALRVLYTSLQQWPMALEVVL